MVADIKMSAKLSVYILSIGIFGLCFCADQDCRGDSTCKETIDIPLTDKIDAPLKAQLDITLLNNQLRELIKEEVTRGVKKVMNDLIDKSVEDKIQGIRDKLPAIISGPSLETAVQVGFTSCSGDHIIVSRGNTIKFNDGKTSYGVTNFTQFLSSGVFTCEVPGLYQIIATVKTHTNAATFGIYKNDVNLISGYVAEHSLRDATTNYDHTSTAVVVVKLSINDTISVLAGIDMYLHSETCVSVVRF